MLVNNSTGTCSVPRNELHCEVMLQNERDSAQSNGRAKDTGSRKTHDRSAPKGMRIASARGPYLARIAGLCQHL
ncbi:MAG: hypothetical protein K0R08_224 [Solimicrobium sp.]|jgi:hypothetical protein|nr:hypothetical protein [Solimicrobium sp.]